MRKIVAKGIKLIFVFALFGTLGFLCFSEGTQAEDDPVPVRNLSYLTQSSFDANSFMSWNTFMGSSSDDGGCAVALDGSGNIYVAASGDATWGSPLSPYVGDYDVFIAKLNSNGVLQWNTFLGSDSYDACNSIAVDGSDNVYVAGISNKTWGTPLNPHTGNPETFLAKLNSSGTLQWNTFIGNATGSDWEGSMTVDSIGNAFVTGTSTLPWGSPVNPHTGYGNFDAFVAKFVQEPEINVKFRGIRIPDGASANLGTRPSSLIMGREFTLTIENLGAAPLNLTGSPNVTLSGPQATHFSISQQPTSPVASFGTTTFKLRTVRGSLPGFLPAGWTYPVSITVNIPNDDADENPYDFTINFTLEKDS